MDGHERRREYGVYKEGAIVSKRKPYNEYEGYVASRRNPITGGWLVLWDTSKTDQFDSSDGRWVTTCETHHTICNHRNQKIARSHLPTAGWCEECMDMYTRNEV